MSRQLLAAPAVAKLLGHSSSWFYRNRGRLEEQHGFPAPVAGCGLRWDSAAIHRWLDAQQAPGPAGAAGDVSALLIQRAGAMAAA